MKHFCLLFNCTYNSAGRMRVWRSLKAMGCGVLRDGVYLLPYQKEFRKTLQIQAEDVIAGGGNAHVLALNSENQNQQQVFQKLFDRSDNYAKLVENIKEIQFDDLTKLQKQLQRLRKDFETIALLDFFPNAAREQVAAALEDLEYSAIEHLSPNEPHAVYRRIMRLKHQDYQGRTWVTRQRPRIDRLASAWLIHRFIDPEACFIWLVDLNDCPAEALGFDFDGATFTHVGAKVTFEVLLANFGLTKDVALNRLGALVHYLDVGGIPVLEAAGLETLIRGMQQRWLVDDELLAETEKIFDAFYQAFSGNDS